MVSEDRQILPYRPHFIAQYDPASHTVFGIIQDITGRKKIERALRLSESKFRMLVENINDVIFSVNPKGQIAYFSPAGERLFGYRSADLAGRFFLDMVYEEDRRLFRRGLSKWKREC